MNPPSNSNPDPAPGRGLSALAAAADRDFARMRFPAPNWVPVSTGPDGRSALDVLVIGGGMCGQTLGLALMRDGVRNVRIIDRAARGREGPWGTYARMETLRSPKHLTGPDLGFPALTFRAWYEARHGEEGWERLYKIATADWLDYLLWVRDTAGVPVENGVEATDIEPAQDLVRVALPWRGRERGDLRAQGGAGGRPRRLAARPTCRRFLRCARACRISATACSTPAIAIDFARFRGGRIGVLGASASAFDNAAMALESRCARGASVLSPAAPAADQQGEVDRVCRVLRGLSRAR